MDLLNSVICFLAGGLASMAVMLVVICFIEGPPHEGAQKDTPAERILALLHIAKRRAEQSG